MAGVGAADAKSIDACAIEGGSDTGITDFGSLVAGSLMLSISAFVAGVSTSGAGAVFAAVGLLVDEGASGSGLAVFGEMDAFEAAFLIEEADDFASDGAS